METEPTLGTSGTGLGHSSKLIHSALVQGLKGMPRGAAWVSAALRAVIDPFRSKKALHTSWN